MIVGYDSPLQDENNLNAKLLLEWRKQNTERLTRNKEAEVRNAIEWRQHLLFMSLCHLRQKRKNINHRKKKMQPGNDKEKIWWWRNCVIF